MRSPGTTNSRSTSITSVSRSVTTEAKPKRRSDAGRRHNYPNRVGGLRPRIILFLYCDQGHDMRPFHRARNYGRPQRVVTQRIEGRIVKRQSVSSSAMCRPTHERFGLVAWCATGAPSTSSATSITPLVATLLPTSAIGPAAACQLWPSKNTSIWLLTEQSNLPSNFAITEPMCDPAWHR
jgi:hypothetical protein